MADCNASGLAYLTPLGSACAVSLQSLLGGGSSQSTFTSYSAMLNQGLLQPTVSRSALDNLRTIAAAALAAASLGVALWCLLIYRHIKGMRRQRFLLVIDNGEGRNVYLADPVLAWSIPSTMASILLVAWCITQQSMYGASHTLLYGSAAYPGLILLLFVCVSAPSLMLDLLTRLQSRRLAALPRRGL
jgi:hypothetical protein